MAGNGALLLRGGTLVDVRTGECTPDAALAIEGGRISRVGRVDEIQPPPDARIEDTSGAWLIPGLVDMHVHITFDRLHIELLPLYLAHGVTTVRDVGGYLTTLTLLRDEIGSGKRIAPHLHFAGPILDGIPPLWPQETVLVHTENRARSAVRMLIEQGVDCIKVYNNVPETSLQAIVAEAHAAGRIVLGHVPRSLSMTRAVEIGMDCLEHIRVTGRELLAADEADEIDYLPLGTRETLLWERFKVESAGMERLIGRLAESRVFLDPTLIVDAAMFAGPVEDAEADELEAQLPDEVQKALHRERWMDDLSGPEEMAERARRGFAKRLQFIAKCNAAGVRLLAGTDTFGSGALLPGVSLLNELELLHRGGLSPLEALRAATITPAVALGVEDKAGTIEAGKRADIVALDADPTVHPRNVRRTRLVVKGGELFTPAGLINSLATREAVA